jgi:hypothetical protein
MLRTKATGDHLTTNPIGAALRDTGLEADGETVGSIGDARILTEVVPQNGFTDRLAIPQEAALTSTFRR